MPQTQTQIIHPSDSERSRGCRLYIDDLVAKRKANPWNRVYVNSEKILQLIGFRETFNPKGTKKEDKKPKQYFIYDTQEITKDEYIYQKKLVKQFKIYFDMQPDIPVIYTIGCFDKELELYIKKRINKEIFDLNHPDGILEEISEPELIPAISGNAINDFEIE